MKKTNSWLRPCVLPLHFIFSMGRGADHIDLRECARRGVAVAMLIDVLRLVSVAEWFLRRGLWPL